MGHYRVISPDGWSLGVWRIASRKVYTDLKRAGYKLFLAKAA